MIGSFIFSSLVMIPVIIILVELMVVHMFKHDLRNPIDRCGFVL